MSEERYLKYANTRPSDADWFQTVPKHWETRRLGLLFREDNARATTTTELQYPILSVSIHHGISDKEMSDEELDRIVNRSEDRSLYKVVHENDLAYNMMRAWQGGFGAAKVAGLISPAYVVCRPRSDLKSGYFELLLRTPNATTQLKRYSRGITDFRLRLYWDNFKNILVPVPPKNEQESILAFLDHETSEINALIEMQRQLIALLEERRTALITHAITSGLDEVAPMIPTQNSMFPLLPVGWKIRKLSRLIHRVVRPVDVNPDTVYREIGVRSWGKGVFHKEPMRGAQLGGKKVFYVCPGDLVFNIVFAWEGAVAVLSERETNMIGSHRFPTFRHDEEKIDLDYLLMILQTDHGRTLMGLNSPGAAGRNKTIRLGSFLAEEIPLPPLETQRAVVQQFREEEERLAALTEKSETLIERLQERSTALISAAVTGKIDVRGWKPPSSGAKQETEMEVA